MKNTWLLAFRNLARNKRRNFATGTAIAVGFAALLALGGYTNRVQNFLQVHAIYVKQVGHLVIYKNDGLDRYATNPREYSLEVEAQKKIEHALTQLPNVEFFTPQLIGSGLVGNGCKSLPFIASSLDPRIDQKIRSHPEMRYWTPQFTEYLKGKGLWEYPADYGAVALSQGLARLLGKSRVISDYPEGKPPLVLVDCLCPMFREEIAADANVQLVSGSWAGGMSALDGEVVAHYSTGITDTNSTALVTSLAHLQKLYGTDNVTSFSIWLKDAEKLAGTMAELSRQLKDEGLAVNLYRWDDERISPFYKGTMDFLYTMIGFIFFILGVIIVFSIFNATTITIIERAQEIGMMRSLGFTRMQIRALYVREVVILAFLSIAIGGSIGGLGILALNNAEIIFHPPGVAGGMPLLLMPSSLIIASAATAIFGLAMVTTYLAMHNVTCRRIPVLLSGVQR